VIWEEQVVFRIFFIFIVFLNAKNIMVVPLDMNYSDEKELSIGEDFFDEVNSAILDANIIYKKNKNKSSLFVKESLLPNKFSQKVISKFYNNDNNISYLKKVSNYYNLDILIFSHIKAKKDNLVMSIFVYKNTNKPILEYSKKVFFNEDTYNLDEKALKQIKNKLIKFIMND
jgi:hypothetical protein